MWEWRGKKSRLRGLEQAQRVRETSASTVCKRDVVVIRVAEEITDVVQFSP